MGTAVGDPASTEAQITEWPGPELQTQLARARASAGELGEVYAPLPPSCRAAAAEALVTVITEAQKAPHSAAAQCLQEGKRNPRALSADALGSGGFPPLLGSPEGRE